MRERSSKVEPSGAGASLGSVFPRGSLQGDAANESSASALGSLRHLCGERREGRGLGAAGSDRVGCCPRGSLRLLLCIVVSSASQTTAEFEGEVVFMLSYSQANLE